MTGELRPVDRPSADVRTRALIAVADDLYGVGLARVLRDAGIDVVGRVRSASAAAETIHELGVTVVLLELRQPGVGAVAIARLRELPDPPGVLALSASPTDAEAVEALAAGACGYLPMNAHAARLAQSVRALHEGDVIMTAGVADGVLAPLRAAELRAAREELAGEPLTPRELAVIARVARGLRNDEIARELVVTSSTVKNHLTRIVAKLGARNRTHAAVLAVHRHYV